MVAGEITSRKARKWRATRPLYRRVAGVFTVSFRVEMGRRATRHATPRGPSTKAQGAGPGLKPVVKKFVQFPDPNRTTLEQEAAVPFL